MSFMLGLGIVVVGPGLSVLVIGSLGVVALAARARTWLLAAFLAVYPLLNARLVELDLLGRRMNASQLSVVLVAALLVFAWLLDRRELTRRIAKYPPAFLLPQLGLALLLVGSLVWTLNPLDGRGAAFRMAVSVGLLFVIYLEASHPKARRIIIWGLIAGSTGTALLAVLEKLAGGDESTRSISIGAFRAAGSMGGGPVVTGTLCMAGCFLAVVVITRTGGVQRAVAAIALSINAMGVLASITRTAILGALIFALVGWLILGRRQGYVRLALAYGVPLGIAAVVALTFVVSPQDVAARTDDLQLGTTDFARLGSSRGLIWASCIDGVREGSIREWLVGRGVSSAHKIVGQRIPMEVGAHNSTLQLLADAGLLGVVLYALSFIMMWSALSRRQHSTRSDAAYYALGLAALVAYYASTEMFNQFIYQFGPRVWGLALPVIAVAVVNTVEREDSGAELEAE
jgi:hypothetical protein